LKKTISMSNDVTT